MPSRSHREKHLASTALLFIDLHHSQKHSSTPSLLKPMPNDMYSCARDKWSSTIDALSSSCQTRIRICPHTESPSLLFNYSAAFMLSQSSHRFLPNFQFFVSLAIISSKHCSRDTTLIDSFIAPLEEV